MATCVLNPAGILSGDDQSTIRLYNTLCTNSPSPRLVLFSLKNTGNAPSQIPAKHLLWLNNLSPVRYEPGLGNVASLTGRGTQIGQSTLRSRRTTRSREPETPKQVTEVAEDAGPEAPAKDVPRQSEPFIVAIQEEPKAPPKAALNMTFFKPIQKRFGMMKKSIESAASTTWLWMHMKNLSQESPPMHDPNFKTINRLAAEANSILRPIRRQREDARRRRTRKMEPRDRKSRPMRRSRDGSYIVSKHTTAISPNVMERLIQLSEGQELEKIEPSELLETAEEAGSGWDMYETSFDVEEYTRSRTKVLYTEEALEYRRHSYLRDYVEFRSFTLELVVLRDELHRMLDSLRDWYDECSQLKGISDNLRTHFRNGSKWHLLYRKLSITRERAMERDLHVIRRLVKSTFLASKEHDFDQRYKPWENIHGSAKDSVRRIDDICQEWSCLFFPKPPQSYEAIADSQIDFGHLKRQHWDLNIYLPRWETIDDDHRRKITMQLHLLTVRSHNIQSLLLSPSSAFRNVCTDLTSDYCGFTSLKVYMQRLIYEFTCNSRKRLCQDLLLERLKRKDKLPEWLRPSAPFMLWRKRKGPIFGADLDAITELVYDLTKRATEYGLVPKEEDRIQELNAWRAHCLRNHGIWYLKLENKLDRTHRDIANFENNLDRTKKNIAIGNGETRTTIYIRRRIDRRNNELREINDRINQRENELRNPQKTYLRNTNLENTRLDNTRPETTRLKDPDRRNFDELDTSRIRITKSSKPRRGRARRCYTSVLRRVEADVKSSDEHSFDELDTSRIRITKSSKPRRGRARRCYSRVLRSEEADVKSSDEHSVPTQAFKPTMPLRQCNTLHDGTHYAGDQATKTLESLSNSQKFTNYSDASDGVLTKDSGDAEQNDSENASSYARDSDDSVSEDGDTEYASSHASDNDESASENSENGIDSENESEAEEEHEELTYQIPADTLRECMSASPTSPKAYYSHSWYRGPNDRKVMIHYCRNRKVSEEILKHFIDEPLLGFDIEWKPNAFPTAGAKDNASLIQLASESRIGLFHVSLWAGSKDKDHDLLPPSLKQILESDAVTKIGVAITADTTRLRKHFGIEPRGLFELSHVYRLVTYSNTTPKDVNKRLVSLATQVQEHLQLPLAKGSVRESDWSKELNHEQVSYAATDAYAGLRLYDVLEAKRKKMKPPAPRPAFAELKLPIQLPRGVAVPKTPRAKVMKKGTTRIDHVMVADTDDENEDEENYDTAPEDQDEDAVVTSAAKCIGKLRVDLDLLRSTPSSSIIYPTLPAESTESDSDLAPDVHTSSDNSDDADALTDSSAPIPEPTVELSALLEAAAWEADFRATRAAQVSSALKIGSTALQAYSLWYHQKLPLTEIGGLLRDKPLAESTISKYILDCLMYEDMDCDERIVDVWGRVPLYVRDARYKRLAARLGKKGLI